MQDFDMVFGDVERCLQAGRLEAVRRAAGCARKAAAGDTHARPQSALDGLLEFAEQQQELAGLCVAMAVRAHRAPVDAELLAVLAPPLARVARVIGVLAEDPASGQRLAARAGLASVTQAGRVVVRLCELGLLDEASRPPVVTAAGRAFAERAAAG